VEDELVNHVKVHQIFNILKEDFKEEESSSPLERDPIIGNLWWNSKRICKYPRFRPGITV